MEGKAWGGESVILTIGPSLDFCLASRSKRFSSCRRLRNTRNHPLAFSDNHQDMAQLFDDHFRAGSLHESALFLCFLSIF